MTQNSGIAKEQLCRSVEQNVRNVSDKDNLPVHVPCPADDAGKMNSQGISALRCSVEGRWNCARNRSSFVGLASGRGGIDESSSVLRKGSEALRMSSKGEAMLGFPLSALSMAQRETVISSGGSMAWCGVCVVIDTGEMSLKFTTCLGLVMRV